MLIALGIAVMALSLFLIPLGLPGHWIMIGVLGVAAYFGELGLATLLPMLALAVGAECAEWIVVKRLSRRYGGSRRAFWGAMVGGLAGALLIGAPVPLVGPVLAGLLGAAVGGAGVTLWETRRLGSAARVGWGVALGWGLAAALKTAFGVAILVSGVIALVR